MEQSNRQIAEPVLSLPIEVADTVHEPAKTMHQVDSEVPHIRVLNSTEGGDFFKALLSEISAQGFEVSHHYTLSEQAYRRGRHGLRKFVNLWKMYPWYCLKTYLRPPRADAYISTTNPFFLPAALRLRVGEKRCTVFLIYDLYPDAMELAGILSPRGWLSRLCASCTGYAIRNSSATVFLGEVLREHIETRYGRAKKAVVIPVGADGGPFADSAPQDVDPSQAIRIMYCGNLGRAHDSGTLVDYLKTSDDARFEFQFHAFGNKYNQLRGSLSGESSDPRCSLSGPLDAKRWAEAMRAAHVALVTVSPGWERVVMPSKTYSAMVAGQAILAICSSKSDLAELVREHDCGWVVAPGDVEGLRDILEQQISDHALLAIKRQNAYAAGHEYYSCKALALRWAELLGDLQSASSPNVNR